MVSNRGVGRPRENGDSHVGMHDQLKQGRPAALHAMERFNTMIDWCGIVLA